MKKLIITATIIIIGLIAAGFTYWLSESYKSYAPDKLSPTTDIVSKEIKDIINPPKLKDGVIQSNNKTNNNTNNNNNNNTINKNDNSDDTTTSFSDEESATYYKLAQIAGDYGLPAKSLVVNLSYPKKINGINYYKAYSYSTRSNYGKDKTTPINNNYSHFDNVKIISLDGKSISTSQFGEMDFSKLTSKEKYNEVYKLAAQYVQAYTANYPDLSVSSNDNYEGNLNNVPDLKINLNDTKIVNGQTLYQVIVSTNNYETPIYVGIDGFIFVNSETDFNQLFFPNKLK